ncbi:cytochrome P450 [Gluconacetobacter diazotrophicus]|uniref:Cytochrome P450 n=1 Tax=Gluconacetobacter diazotrophicus TaxID=33996 RepID=A0A7W4FEN3_GLUDI|nr:cytochrome P450 [Gluconacetobacter diazotrophicus]MBB2156340.1 cytochrome P450 [Gluconacetobacter diazotrophicus]
MEFIPPFPPRPKTSLSVFELLRRGTQNFLNIWEEKAFEYQTMSMQVLARQVFICNSPDTVRHAFITRAENFQRKSPQIRNALSPLLGDGLFVSDGETWKQRRQMVSPVLHTSRMDQFAPAMVETVGELADRWAALPDGATFDVLKVMAQLTAEIICRAVFGRTLGAEHAREVAEAFTEYQKYVDQSDLASFGLPSWVPRRNGAKTRRATARIHAVLDGIIADLQRTEDDGSVIRMLMRDGVMDATALRNEAAVIFLAGHETTANCLSWVWYLLSQAPEVEARLHEELDTVLGSRAPTFADVSQLVYTRAIVEETLRLYPPVPLLAREAKEDDTIRSRKVKAGALVMVVPWLLHRHRLYWRKPDHFMPERFLPGSPDAPQKYTYVPFSIGPRICPGLSFGLVEAIICLASLARGTTLRLAPGAVVEPVCRLTLRPGDTLPMTVWKRTAAAGTRPVPAGASAQRCPVHHG